MIYLFDSNPLSLLANTTRSSPDAWQISRWVIQAIDSGHIIAIPEISYYESRRELVRAKKSESVKRLDELSKKKGSKFVYLPISKNIIIEATRLWALARQKGYQTAHDEALDGDVILAATAVVISSEYGIDSLVITENTNHIERYTPSKNWKDILFD